MCAVRFAWRSLAITSRCCKTTHTTQTPSKTRRNNDDATINTRRRPQLAHRAHTRRRCGRRVAIARNDRVERLFERSALYDRPAGACGWSSKRLRPRRRWSACAGIKRLHELLRAHRFARALPICSTLGLGVPLDHTRRNIVTKSPDRDRDKARAVSRDDRFRERR